jgi:hypothetical protein
MLPAQLPKSFYGDVIVDFVNFATKKSAGNVPENFKMRRK